MYTNNSNTFYNMLAEQNRVAMLKSYYNIHHNNNNYENSINISTEDYIFKNINYKDIKSINSGIDNLFEYINNVELYYLTRGIDPDEVSYCNNLWIKYYKLKKYKTDNFENIIN